MLCLKASVPDTLHPYILKDLVRWEGDWKVEISSSMLVVITFAVVFNPPLLDPSYP